LRKKISLPSQEINPKKMLRLFLALAYITAGLFLVSCDKEERFITDSSAMLEFSTDTLRIDTVFTSLGSATRILKVYNPNERPIRVAKIYLDGQAGQTFRLNVDGLAGNTHENVVIHGRDSIYIFVEATINPNQPLSVSPFVVEDKLVLETNGNRQQVLLEAWGQNANYFPSRFNKGVAVVIRCNNGEVIWDDPKPYVVYGALFIDDCTLVIPAGARVYIHGGVAQNDLFGGIYNDGLLYTLSNGRIKVRGTAEQPVIIQGSRTEEAFANVRGQWNGIILGKGSRGNEFRYATVKNSRFALLVDSAAEVSASNARFFNTSGNGIVGFHARITADNCLIYNNGSNSVQLLFGGDYAFNYCTIANYGVNAGTLGMSNFWCYDDPLVCQNRREYRLNATFVNSIIYGSRRDQLEFSDISQRQSPAMFNVSFQHCVVRVDELLTRQNGRYGDFFSTMCSPCTNGTAAAKVFENPNSGVYMLDSLSLAQAKARPLSGIPRDIVDKLRDPVSPDAGCFERD